MSIRLHTREWWSSRPMHLIKSNRHYKVIIAFINGAITERKVLNSDNLWESCEHWKTCLFVDSREYRIQP